MKKANIILFLLGFLVFGCSNRTNKNAIEVKTVIENSIEQLSPIDLTFATITKKDKIQTSVFSSFITDYRDNILSDFRAFWSQKLDFVSYNISITDSSIYTLEGESYGIIKLSVNATLESGSIATADNIYLIRVTEKNSFLFAFQIGFFQAECGVPDLNIESIGKFKLNTKTYYFIKRQEKTFVCCGGSEEKKIFLLVFGNNKFDEKIGEIMVYHKNYHNDGCDENKPDETKIIHMYSSGDNLILVSESKVENQELVTNDTSFYTIDKVIKTKK